MGYTKHGMSKHKLYKTWSGMKGRCNNPLNRAYMHYGGRGIKVCEEWENSFNAFLEWSLTNGWGPGLSIDRIDVNGNYEPNNCRWTDIKTQMRNRRNNVLYTYDNQTKSLSEWSEVLGIPRSRLEKRLNKYGKSAEEAFFEKWMSPTYEYGGETHTLSEWSRITKINRSTLENRIVKQGLSFEVAITTPLRGWKRKNKEDIKNDI